MPQDIEIVDRRLVNYLTRKYRLADVLPYRVPRKLTFKYFGPATNNPLPYILLLWRGGRKMLWLRKKQPAWDYFVIMMAIFLCVLVIPVELTIAINKVPNVNTLFQPGQMLALVATLGGVFAIGMGLVFGDRKEAFGGPVYLPDCTYSCGTT